MQVNRGGWYGTARSTVNFVRVMRAEGEGEGEKKGDLVECTVEHWTFLPSLPFLTIYICISFFFREKLENFSRIKFCRCFEATVLRKLNFFLVSLIRNNEWVKWNLPPPPPLSFRNFDYYSRWKIRNSGGKRKRFAIYPTLNVIS